jgi:hypothetical protein
MELIICFFVMETFNYPKWGEPPVPPITPSRPSTIFILYHFASRGSLMKNTFIFPGFPVDSADPKGWNQFHLF